MRPLPTSGGERSHLAPCPDCGAANGVNAPRCWKCESALPVSAYPPAAITKDAATATPPDPRLEHTPEPAPVALHVAADAGSAAQRQPELDAAAPERLYATLGDASNRASRRRRAVAAGTALFAIAAGAIGYTAFQDPVHIALSPAELSRAVQPEPPSPPMPAARPPPAVRAPKVQGGAAVAATAVAQAAVAPRSALRGPAAPTARAKHGTRRVRNPTAAPRARSVKATTRQAVREHAGKAVRSGSTAHSNRRRDTPPARPRQ